MDTTNTSGGEELLTKARKPYTITKQRERWTEDEHERFLEALRLYGRAWQRIEEHIGTKTAVQIRSHAQKFFTKLEKEAETKGIPVCQALDIEIPPPRPKRKPNTPYPRKPGNNVTSSSQVSSAKDAKLVSSASSSQCNNHAFLDLEKMPFSEKTSTEKENQDDSCSGVSTMNKYPLPKKVTPRKGNADIETSKNSTVHNAVQDVPKKNKDKDGNDGTVHSLQNYPWHFHADIVNGNIPKCPQNHPSGMVSQDFMFHPMREEIHGHGNRQATTTASASTTTTCHQAFPACHSQDDYRSFLQMSSTFSNLIMSTLLQNSAAHAAATYAASVWPYASAGNYGDSSTPVSFSPPSIAAIAAATVAAATAWWASHGLLPVCAPAPVTCVPLPTDAVPTPAMTEMDTVENAQPLLEKQNTALQDQNLASKSPDSSSDDSEETGVTKLNAVSKTNGDKIEEVIVTAAVHDSNVTKKKNLVDRSSCGSNTPSGSDVETDALDKMEKDNEEVKETDENQPDVNELNNRKIKLRDNNNNQATDSWKEVSEEGRIAFQALFARERLPQSFSPPLLAENVNGRQSDTSMPLAPDFKVQASCDADQERLVMIGVGPGKSLKTRQTGFKPYKRCSMELTENQVGNTNNQSDEKVCKRLRLEGEAST
ncbi:PREDICTED: protein LHY isoform X1 [Camelina sativa]|uniref:Protein LHY isoform X1 n=2 Tax=Camelina sativa TaxID=90675 RepID=A0ABM0X4U1_CAMSA|nr:PREDICTED: protein LHY isoform X1 [Camelina sativa]XP_010480699.1 PREDICTED: protein LHY isoform X1 [Camelina sativa]